MFISFVEALRRGGIPASLKEHLLLLEALDAEVIAADPEQFYYLARAVFVHDETMLDRFDRIFGEVFKGVLAELEDPAKAIPEDWLKLVAEKYLTPEEMERIKALGSWDEIMEALRQRLEEQQGRHEGGSKWIGTGGTSPFGHGGNNPDGVRIGGPPPTSSTSTPRSTARRGRAGSTSTCGPSGTMRSNCCCSSTSAGRWKGM